MISSKSFLPLFLFAVLLVAVPQWIQTFRPQPYQILPPPIPGATLDEQRGEAVNRGFALGRQHRMTLLQAHGDSWDAAAQSLDEPGMTWDKVKADWAGPDRAWRDAPFDHVVEPEVRRILGDKPDEPARVRSATLFLRAFSAGLKDRR